MPEWFDVDGPHWHLLDFCRILEREFGQNFCTDLLQAVQDSGLKPSAIMDWLRDKNRPTKAIIEGLDNRLRVIEEADKKTAGLRQDEKTLLDLVKSEPFTLQKVTSLLELIGSKNLSMDTVIETVKRIGGESKGIILSIIEAYGGHCSAKAIVRAAKHRSISEKEVHKAVRELVKEGKLKHENRSYVISTGPPGLKGLQSISRKDLEQFKPGVVAVCSAKVDGIDFLRKHDAWGFVNISRKPDYFALYVSRPYSAITVFGEVKEIRRPEKGEYEGYDYQEGKKLIVLRPGTLRRLAETIPLGQKKGKAPQSLRFTSLSGLAKAKTLDDLEWGKRV